MFLLQIQKKTGFAPGLFQGDELDGKALQVRGTAEEILHAIPKPMSLNTTVLNISKWMTSSNH
jgi:hypothetical protein